MTKPHTNRFKRSGLVVFRSGRFWAVDTSAATVGPVGVARLMHLTHGADVYIASDYGGIWDACLLQAGQFWGYLLLRATTPTDASNALASILTCKQCGLATSPQLHIYQEPCAHCA